MDRGDDGTVAGGMQEVEHPLLSGEVCVFKRLESSIMSCRTILLGGAAAFFVCCLVRAGFKVSPFGARSPAVSSGPLACDEVVYDFGTRPIGESVGHVFCLRNGGYQDLEIAGVRSGCSCARAELSEKVIRPGCSVLLKVTVSLENLRGPVEQHFVVEASDPAQRFLVLKTRGVVESAFDVKPHAIDVGKVVQGKELEGCVVIEATGPGPLELGVVACESPLCRLSQQTLEAGRSYRVSVRTTGELPLGFWKTVLKIRTDHPKEPQIVVPVVARVVAEG